ncbi:DNA primase [Photobacterium phosphoreum]|uniref:DNA primase n=1 Tax=Photobacterium phosphoreum TaxID=659 RepID=UPI0005D400D1|nr:DNA primase [Photobacterium phosphoreum]KJF87835.1 DNA primase [Photobacterium phosphoreum]MCD9480000.1 DNA primase [Photobacterium phosphoreum]OBU36515.1 DNA primase [Photobacterium phosphoreum]PQJ83920.1 DNA primase [Photobacterium phosphoreum]PSU38152.1 DNA primase [Photobacterium phosphoreum]
MSGKIPRSFIDDLISRHDIVDVIDARVKLKKQGKNFGACCPFHNEKTPSFSVSQEKQFYHCFGCGVHGNVLDFVMEYDRLEFVDAIEDLASQLGLEVPRENDGNNFYKNEPTVSKAQRLDIYNLLNQASILYVNELKKEENKHAVEYLKQRGLSGEIAKKFSIGFVPNSWDFLKRHLGKDQTAIDYLETSGMLVVSDSDSNKIYDRFRNRIMFPIRGHKSNKGKIIGFGGRVLDNSVPKYLNSPEIKVFHKGTELYGLYEVLEDNSNPDKIMVVEGYMDVVALAQFGVNYAVASLGTATTGDHIKSLFRQTSTVVCCYDGDRAGREAAWRAMEQALPYLVDGCELKFMFLPDGEDPDTYIRQYGKDEFETQVSSSMSLIDFMFNHLTKQVNMTTKEGKSKLMLLTKPLIEKVAGETLREYLINKLGYSLGLPPDQIRVDIKRTQQETPRLINQSIKRTPMREVIALLIQHPLFVNQLKFDTKAFEDIELAGLNLLLSIVEKCRINPNVSTGQLLESWRNTKDEAMMARLAAWELPLSKDEDSTLEVFLDAMDNVINQCVQKQIEKLQAKSSTVGLSVEEKQELQSLLLDRPA